MTMTTATKVIPAATISPKQRITSGSNRVEELDGFRAIAIMVVLIHHAFFGWPLPERALSWMPRILTLSISHGWLGVDLFFILSGFLITGILSDSRDKPHYFRNFYVRRVLRILPLYYVCILIMSFAYRTDAKYFALSVLFLANFARYFSAEVPHGPAVFWSLAVEAHFYFVWPLLVRLLSRYALLVLSLVPFFGTAILRGVCRYWGMDPMLEIYSYSFFRFDGFALGSILAIWVRSPSCSHSSAWRIARILAGVSLLLSVIGLPFGIMQTKTVAGSALHYTMAQLFFAAAIVLTLAYRGTTYTAFLRSRVAKFTAGLSYCIYLTQSETFTTGY